jgi:hypothetical protein
MPGEAQLIHALESEKDVYVAESALPAQLALGGFRARPGTYLHNRLVEDSAEIRTLLRRCTHLGCSLLRISAQIFGGGCAENGRIL